jgi:proteic killer suppression protein
LRFRFTNRKLERLYTEGKGAKKYPSGVIDSFFEVMAAIRAATSTMDLRAMKGLRFERLKGKRTGQCSLRLNDQYRLVVVIEAAANDEDVVVVEIVDYH